MDTIKHPNPSNKAEFLPFPEQGVKCHTTFPIAIHENDFVVRRGDILFIDMGSQDNESLWLARTFALAVKDGVGEPLDPPYFASIVLHWHARAAYLRFIPQDVVRGAARREDLQALRWLLNSDEFNHFNTEKLIVAEEAGMLTAPMDAFLHDNCDLHFPSWVAAWRSVFGGDMITQPVYAFERWLYGWDGIAPIAPTFAAARAAKKLPGTVRPLPALDLLQTYLREHPILLRDLKQLQNRAELLDGLPVADQDC